MPGKRYSSYLAQAGKRRKGVTAKTRWASWRSKLRTQASRPQFALGGGVAPTRMKKKFIYSDQITMNAGAAGAAVYNFSCNSLFDPNRTGVGHQPMGFDQLMLLYDHFVVTEAKISVMALSQGVGAGSALDNQVMVLSLRDTTDGVSNIQQAIELGYAKVGLLGSQNGGNSGLQLDHYVDVGKFLGRANLLSDPDVKGGNGGNPTEECFFQIALASIDGDDPPAVDLLVTIEYTAYLIEPKKLTQS